jgi:hypothetical protein
MSSIVPQSTRFENTFITTVAGGSIIADSDVTNDCGESLYEIESTVCEEKQRRIRWVLPGNITV